MPTLRDLLHRSCKRGRFLDFFDTRGHFHNFPARLTTDVAMLFLGNVLATKVTDSGLSPRNTAHMQSDDHFGQRF